MTSRQIVFKKDTSVVISNSSWSGSYGTQRMDGPCCVLKVLFANGLLLLLNFISISSFGSFHLGPQKEKK